MCDSVYQAIIMPMNQCSLTGLESLAHTERMGKHRINIFVDNYSQYRITLTDIESQQIVSAILFDNSKIIRFKYTRPEYRNQGLTKQLFAYIQYKVKRKFYHSQNLTIEGAAAI